MKIEDVPYTTIDLSAIPPTEHPGAPGMARWHTWEMGNLRVRMVEFSPGYVADHCAAEATSFSSWKAKSPRS